MVRSVLPFSKDGNFNGATVLGMGKCCHRPTAHLSAMPRGKTTWARLNARLGCPHDLDGNEDELSS